MAAKFNPKRAAQRNQQLGDAVPVHAVIPTDDPWVPLRILGLGKTESEIVDADVYLLTDEVPEMLPAPELDSPALKLKESSAASKLLLSDLRSDKGMKWLPTDDMWLTYLRVKGKAGELKHDLAIDVGTGEPSPVDAGLAGPSPTFVPSEDSQRMWAWALALVLAGFAVVGADRLTAARR
jgi:hypothetical protein